jgi:hypothetical protein
MARMIYQHATTKADQAIAKALGETISAARDDKVGEHDEERSAAAQWPVNGCGPDRSPDELRPRAGKPPCDLGLVLGAGDVVLFHDIGDRCRKT